MNQDKHKAKKELEKIYNDKFFVIDDVEFNIGDVYKVGPNGFFERIGTENALD